MPFSGAVFITFFDISILHSLFGTLKWHPRMHTCSHTHIRTHTRTRMHVRTAIVLADVKTSNKPVIFYFSFAVHQVHIERMWLGIDFINMVACLYLPHRSTRQSVSKPGPYMRHAPALCSWSCVFIHIASPRSLKEIQPVGTFKQSASFVWNWCCRLHSSSWLPVNHPVEWRQFCSLSSVRNIHTYTYIRSLVVASLDFGSYPH